MIVLQQHESEPTSYPTVGTIDADTVAALWRRIENYIAYRWAEREVVWTLEGAGDWTPPLVPATVTKIESWSGSEWLEISDTTGPMGYQFSGGTYRVTATVGSTDEPPQDMQKAIERLEGYSIDELLVSSATSQTIDYGNGLSVRVNRPAAWQAKALQYSGAADLLRRYRRP